MGKETSTQDRDDTLTLTARAATALQSCIRRALAEGGFDDLNAAQLSVLAAVEATEGITSTGLSQQVHYEKSTLTPLLERLESLGLIARARDPKDGRRQLIHITKKGRRRRREAEAIVASLGQTLLGQLPRKVLKHHREFCDAVIAHAAAAREKASGRR